MLRAFPCRVPRAAFAPTEREEEVVAKSRPILQVVTASTRPGRIGASFAEWFAQIAREHGGFEVEPLDLAEIGLPFMDEPNHPKLRDYQHQHTKDWSETVDRADAFVFVTPRVQLRLQRGPQKRTRFPCTRNGPTRAVSFVSYGGIGAGTRAVQQLKQVLTTLRMIPIFESVNIPFATSKLGENGQVIEDPLLELAATQTLDELLRLTKLIRRRPSND